MKESEKKKREKEGKIARLFPLDKEKKPSS